MKKSLASVLLLAPAVILFALPAVADRGDRDGHDHGGDWHGDARHFEHRDFDHWRAGHWRHGWHEGRIGWWWVTDGFWNAYPSAVYPYPDDTYSQPVVVQQAPPTVMIQQPPPGTVPPPAQNWYYCPPSRAYYPYVSTCPVEWQRVPATPPDAPQ